LDLMRVLVTGHRGRLGREVWAALVDAGHDCAGFDVDDGDVRDAAALTAAAAGAAAIVHLAGLADDLSDDPVAKMSVNAVGTWCALLAAEAVGARRLVNFSSAKALGITERVPDYLPIDDDHPARPTLPYGLSKLVSEDLCEAVTRRTGIVTVCLRPVAVFLDADYERWERVIADEPDTVGVPWHMGVFVDARDCATAALAALTRPVSGHLRALLCAADVAADENSRELARRRLPDTPWRGGADRPPRAALIACRNAGDVLGWEPRHSWAGRKVAAA
jgi:nucleoside-diphosphate-sugar epimerase